MTTRNKRQLTHQRTLRRRRARQLARRRRGVLLLVVLSMLVLFMMIGTAFLLTSSQYRSGAKESAKLNRVGNHPQDLLDRALFQVLRDTTNPNSVARYHSLLRDMYGADGFEGEVYFPEDVDLNTMQGQVARYSGATNNLALGPTNGQLIDLYIRDIDYRSLADPKPLAEPRHIIKLERDIAGNSVDHTLPLTTGYYNGTLLSVTSGPARGASARVVDYQFIGELPANAGRLFRLRVVAFHRADGKTLQVNTARAPELSELAGATIIVNGRPFNGTGVGYDTFAGLDPLTGQFQPRLSALEAVQIAGSHGPTFVEYALAPNAIYASPLNALHFAPDPNNPPPRPNNPFFGNPLSAYLALNRDAINYASYVGPGDTDESYDAPDFQNMFLAHESVTPRSRGRLAVNGNLLSPDDPSFGDAERDYGSVGRLDLEDLPLPSFHRPALVNFWFHRLVDLAASGGNPTDDHVRAVLQPYGPDGLRGTNDDPNVNLATRDQIVSLKRRFIMRPLREDHPSFDGSNPASRGLDWSNVTNLIRTAVVQRSVRAANIMAPSWEVMGPWDVDNDNDGIADSVWIDLGEPVQQAEDGTLYKPLYSFKIVDLDSRLNVNAHGTADHINPPPFDAGRIALAGMEPLVPRHREYPAHFRRRPSTDMMPQGVGWGTAEISLRPLFPAPQFDVLDPPRTSSFANLLDAGNRTEDSNANGLREGVSAGDAELDSYATLLAGRLTATGLTIPGRHGFDPFTYNDLVPLGRIADGSTNDISRRDAATGLTAANVPDRRTQFDAFDHPLFWGDPSSFAGMPDLFGRYAIGLDHAGQPTLEGATEIGQTMLSDSPYELDLSAAARRDRRTDNLLVSYNSTTNVTEYYNSAGTVVDSLTGFVNESDDAPYATADLERVLRAHDPDAGTVPSRLWDVVDAFDPAKLIFDPRMAIDVSNSDPNNPASLEYVAAEQQADVNRRLVTTDSYDLPVPAQSLPAYAWELGPDGQPGRAGVDDNSDNTVDDPTEINSAVSDDFRNIVGNDRTQANVLDLLRYRVWCEFRGQVMRENGWNEISLAGLDPATYANFLSEVTQRTERVLSGDAASGIPPLAGQVLAPESIAGLRVDINRPFGNGEDDNNNGVVDEPLENFGLGSQGPVRLELLFSRAVSGTMRFPGMPDDGVPFSHTNGIDVDNQPNKPLPVDGDDAELSRQLYARHLYVLMLLLMDERYLASQNIENPNVALIVNDLIPRLNAENPNLNVDQLRARAETIALRKLTIQRIAQWAINCVDFRDSDAIMTPFEYDENPFDGWGVWRPNPNEPSRPIFVPLDGNLATNENWGPPEQHDYQQRFPNETQPQPSKQFPNGFRRFFNYPLPKKDELGTANPNDSRVEQATRGIVWGAERPELLITETFAFHDRRATDESDGATHWEIENPDQTLADDDLDQRLLPRGSLFVELYNPWTPDGQKPAELYRYSGQEPGPIVDGSIGLQNGRGVLLNRLSNAPSPLTGKFSPVWRMIAFQDAAAGRLTDRIALTDEDLSNLAVAKLRTIDPDGYGFEADKFAERYIYFTTGRSADAPLDRINRGDDLNLGPVGGVSSEYTTSLNPVLENLNVHVPPLPLRAVESLTGPGPQNEFPRARRYFIAADRRQQNAPNARVADAPIAPIQPGRYAVVGPSGIQYTTNGGGLAIQAGTTTERYVTPIGRRPNQEDAVHTGYQTGMSRTRRIELLPSRNPDLQQVFIDDNSGPEFIKLGSNRFVNVTDQNSDGQPDNDAEVFRLASDYFIPPAVAIPVEDLNISEPPEGYPSIRYRQLSQDSLDGIRTKMNGAGEFELSNANGTLILDTPMDMQLELVRNGTTPNYNVIHLQRLANPLLPWNPAPYDQFGAVNPLHDRNMPVNPYLTIDSSSVDLTAFNGVSDAELNLPSTKANAERQKKGLLAVTADPLLQGIYFAPLDADELKTIAPNYVIRELVKALVDEGILDASWLIRPPDDYRDRDNLESDLRQLESRRRRDFAGFLDNDPSSDRQQLLEGPHSFDHIGTQITGPWGWHRLRRFLPQYEFPTLSRSSISSTDGGSNYRQYIHLKSLERGAHDRVLKLSGWLYDPEWEPRLLWKRERPNGTVYIRNNADESDAFPIRPMSDLVSSKNRALIETTAPTNLLTADDVEFHKFGTGDQRKWSTLPHVFDFAMQTTLGFANEAYTPQLDLLDGDESVMLKGTPAGRGAPQVNTNAAFELDENLEDKERYHAPYDQRRELLSGETTSGAIPITTQSMVNRREKLLNSTFPWLAWSDRPYISQMELLQVPASSSSRLLIDYSVVHDLTLNPYDGDGIEDLTAAPQMPESGSERLDHQSAPFGHLMNFVISASSPAAQLPDMNDLDGDQSTDDVILLGAPNYYRLLDFVHVPSRFVNTDAFLNPLDFSGSGASGAINNPDDPRRYLQPPFNRVSHFREPGRVNLNTVSGRRIPASGNVPPQLWSEVYDGIMHRVRDGERYVNVGGESQTAEGAHFGPAWRDVVLSRRGYAHFAVSGNSFVSLDKANVSSFPDAICFGLNRNFPTFFANPFRSPNAGDLVPLANMVQLGVNAGMLRAHPFNKGLFDDGQPDRTWGNPHRDDDLAHHGTSSIAPNNIAPNSIRVDDTREAGFGNDQLSQRLNTGIEDDNRTLPNTFGAPSGQVPTHSSLPLFSESLTAPHVDGERNPFFFYQPLTRLGNLATTRSGVFAIWITVGYFEVEPAPDWNHPDSKTRDAVRQRFGATGDVDVDRRARELYDRVYPEGYQLGRELGIDTGNARRQRGFYIVDRTLPVGFKPGEDLNVEQMIRLRRRIE